MPAKWTHPLPFMMVSEDKFGTEEELEPELVDLMSISDTFCAEIHVCKTYTQVYERSPLTHCCNPLTHCHTPFTSGRTTTYDRSRQQRTDPPPNHTKSISAVVLLPLPFYYSHLPAEPHSSTSIMSPKESVDETMVCFVDRLLEGSVECE
jgi:hypothetical protein